MNSNRFMKNLKSVLMVLGMFLGMVITGNTAYAEEVATRDISHQVVTDLQVSPTEIQDGGKTTVSLKFAENSQHDIKEGDIISVKWPRQADLQFSGFQKELPLMVKGINVGTVSVREDGAYITFNSSINNLDNVEGFANFEIQGRNLTNTTAEDTKSGQITSGNKYATVRVKKSASGTSSTFYYKTGNIDPADTSHVNWWLNANLQKSYVDKEIRIEDEVQGGQTIVQDSFRITVTDYNNISKDYSITELEKQYSGTRIEIQGQKITVYIPQQWASLHFFSIYYKTKITSFEQKEFENHSKAWFKENGKDEVSGKDFNHSVKNINADAGINGTIRGELKIFKKVEGEDVAIKGVKFKLRNDSGTIIKDGTSEFVLETNEDGIANIKGLPVGKYKVKEISAPDWIEFDPLKSQEVTFEVKSDDNQGTVLDIRNKIKTTNISVEKKWIGEVGEPVTVQLKAEGSDAVLAEHVLNETENWKYTFVGLKKYTANGTLIKYKVEEKEVPNGYQVQYEKDSAGNWTIKNIQSKLEVAKAQLAVKKSFVNTDATARELKGSEFEFVLTDQDGKTKTAKNDKDGNVTFQELTYDKAGVYTYTIAEKNAGQTLDGVSYDAKTITATVTVADNGNGALEATVEYANNDTSFTNQYKPATTSVSLSVNKILTGRQTGAKADEFEFVLKSEDGTELQTAKNKADGSVTFGAINYGATGIYKYTITEKAGSVPGVTYTDKVVTATVTVTDDNKGKLKAAVAYDGDANFINQYKVSKTNIQLKAKKILEGKELTDQAYTFELKENGTVVSTAKNDAQGNIVFNLEYTEAGNHEYTVTEVAGNEPGITYSTASYKVKVSVTDDGNGQLVATVADADAEREFKNVYTPEKPNTPNKPTPPPADHTDKPKADLDKKTTPKKEGRHLPNTGEVVSVIGAIGFVGLSIAGIVYFKKHEG